MKKELVTLTASFNTASVKKGDSFQINLSGGGFVGAVWDAEVVSGKATLISTRHEGSGIACGLITEQRVFKAEEAGEIEILATEKRLGTACTFKVKVS